MNPFYRTAIGLWPDYGYTMCSGVSQKCSEIAKKIVDRRLALCHVVYAHG